MNSGQHHHNNEEHSHAEVTKTERKDPVCGMSTDAPDEFISQEHKGTTYYFCSDHCLKTFQENPAKFVASEEPFSHENSAVASVFTDPVCGMHTEDESAFTPHHHGGNTYYFCSERCLGKFKNDPKHYTGEKTENDQPKKTLDDRGRVYTCPMHPEIEQDSPGACPKCGMALESMTPAANETRTEYTCPMHPEIVQETPGSCPKCGMALESRTISLDQDDENPEYDFMRRRFIFGAVLTVPLVIIAMREMLPGGHLIENLASHRKSGFSSHPWLAGTDSVDASGSLGWLGLLCTGGAIDNQQKPQHVYFDRPGCIRSLYLQSDCCSFPRNFPCHHAWF